MTTSLNHPMQPFSSNTMSKRAHVSLISLAAITILALSSAWQAAPAQLQSAASQAQTSTGYSPVISPYKESFPLTYGEWGARWWQYVYGVPADQNPLSDMTGENCGVGQWGPVFFLVGTTGGSVVRSKCKAPANTGLFLPIINISCAVPEDGDPATFYKLCKQAIDGVDKKSLIVTIDGQKVQNLDEFRAREFFSFTGAIPGVYATSGCTAAANCYEGFHETAYSDGYWVMVNPLRPGRHTIHFEGATLSTDPFYPFTVNVTYNLQVVPPQ